jgi:hypothetical protein
VLLIVSLAFGVFTEVVFWGFARRWLWLAASALMFVIGLLVSDSLFERRCAGAYDGALILGLACRVGSRAPALGRAAA